MRLWGGDSVLILYLTMHGKGGLSDIRRTSSCNSISCLRRTSYPVSAPSHRRQNASFVSPHVRTHPSPLTHESTNIRRSSCFSIARLEHSHLLSCIDSVASRLHSFHSPIFPTSSAFLPLPFLPTAPWPTTSEPANSNPSTMP